mgnify:CR=1 FL=1
MVFKERMRKHGLWRIAIGIDAMVKAVFTAEIRNLAFRGDSRSAKKDDIIAVAGTTLHVVHLSDPNSPTVHSYAFRGATNQQRPPPSFDPSP